MSYNYNQVLYSYKRLHIRKVLYEDIYKNKSQFNLNTYQPKITPQVARIRFCYEQAMDNGDWEHASELSDSLERHGIIVRDNNPFK